MNSLYILKRDPVDIAIGLDGDVAAWNMDNFLIDNCIEIDPVVLREQITTILIGHANDIGLSDFADGKLHKKITNKAVDAVFSLITGETK